MVASLPRHLDGNRFAESSSVIDSACTAPRNPRTLTSCGTASYEMISCGTNTCGVRDSGRPVWYRLRVCTLMGEAWKWWRVRTPGTEACTV